MEQSVVYDTGTDTVQEELETAVEADGNTDEHQTMDQSHPSESDCDDDSVADPDYSPSDNDTV